MRIAILSDRIPPENVGGAGQVAWTLARGLRKLGHEVHVIAATPGTSFEENREGIPTYHLHSRYPPRLMFWFGVYNPQTIGPLRALLKRINPDVVNAHNVHFDLSYTSMSVAHRLGFPVVFTAHDAMPFAYSKLTHFIDPAQRGIPDTFDFRLPRGYNLRQTRLRYNPFRTATIRRILRHDVARRTCVSEIHRRALQANGLDGFQVVYNGVDPAAAEIPEALIQAERDRLGQSPAILFAGRLTHDKGMSQLLDAFALVVRAVPSALLLVLAPTDNISALANQYPELQGVIQFGGWRKGPELMAAFHAVRGVAVPSIILDCAPMVVLEGMAASKAAVVSCFSGAREIVVHGETGFVVNPFDTQTMADSLIRLLSSPDLADRMGQAGHRRLLERFTLDTQVCAMETVYKGI